MKKLLSILTAGLLMLFTSAPVYTGAQTGDLLTYEDNGELLGVASAFAVFVEEDFGANGSDCEGRIFAGHSANVGTARSYAVAEVDGASVIIGNGELSGFDIGNRTFVYGTDGTSSLQGERIYQADLIDTAKEFEALREKSVTLSQLTQGFTTENPFWNAEKEFVGGNQNLNVFWYPEDVTSCNYFFNYIIPDSSYVIVNVPGEDVTLYTQLYGMQLAGHRAQNNKDEISKRVLFNCYEAKTLTIVGTGTLYGTILAPFADAGDNMTEGAHNAGAIIAKSYIGGIEFGSCTYDGGEPDEVQDDTEGTIESTLPTTDSSITDIQVSSTTTVGTTTTEVITTASTTSTTRETATLATTVGSTTNRETTTSASTTTSQTSTSTTTSTTSDTSTETTGNRTTTDGTTTGSEVGTTIGTTIVITTSTEGTTSTSASIESTGETTTTSTSTEGTTTTSVVETIDDLVTDIQTTIIIEEGVTHEETTRTSTDATGTDGTGTTTSESSSVSDGGTTTTGSSTTIESETTTGTGLDNPGTGDRGLGEVLVLIGAAAVVGLLCVCGKREE